MKISYCGTQDNSNPKTLKATYQNLKKQFNLAALVAYHLELMFGTMNKHFIYFFNVGIIAMKLLEEDE